MPNPIDDLADSEVRSRLRNRGVPEDEVRYLIANRDRSRSLSTILRYLGYTVDDITM
jgi:hypothetical protein